MAVLRVGPLPDGALEAAARFHADVLPKARALLPHPPLPGEAHLAFIFPSAPHDHRAWRRAVVQDLARAAAPARVNGIVGEDEAAIAETLAFLETAPGVTGQLLAVEPA
jgi:hypothetical protein